MKRDWSGEPSSFANHIGREKLALQSVYHTIKLCRVRTEGSDCVSLEGVSDVAFVTLRQPQFNQHMPRKTHTKQCSHGKNRRLCLRQHHGALETQSEKDCVCRKDLMKQTDVMVVLVV